MSKRKAESSLDELSLSVGLCNWNSILLTRRLIVTAVIQKALTDKDFEPGLLQDRMSKLLFDEATADVHFVVGNPEQVAVLMACCSRAKILFLKNSVGTA